MSRPRFADLVSRATPFVLVALLGLPTLWPLLKASMLCTHDGGLHYHRLIALRHAIEHGSPLSRWTPALAFGYGNPFFVFRAALSYYLAEAIHLLGLGIPAALNATYALSLLAAGWGGYLLGRDLWRSSAAGLVVAVAYQQAAYQLIDALHRGNLPESVALGLLPIIIWLYLRYLRAPRPLTIATAALSLTVLLLTHNISSLLFIPFLGAALLMLAWAERASTRVAVIAALAIGLGVLAAGFYWIPAVLERDNVSLYLTHTARNNDFHYNFARLDEILSPPAASDPTLLNPPLSVPLGLPLAVLAILGCLTALRKPSGRQDSHRAIILFLAFGTAGFVFMATPASLWLWERLPLIRFVQFPWRMIGRATLPAALLAGAVVPQLPPRFRRPFTGSMIALLVITALPYLYPATCPSAQFPQLADLYDYERATGKVGVDPMGSFFPRSVVQRPEASPMEAALRAGSTARRFDLASLPAGADLERESYGPNQASIDLNTPVGFRALYHTLYYPGWMVKIDGDTVPVEPTPQTGLISFAVPPGSHRLTIRWGWTPLRAGAAAVSLVALAGLIAVARASSPKSERGGFENSCSTLQLPGMLAGLGIALLAFKLLLVDSGHTPLRRGRLVDGLLPGLEHALPVSFADGLELLGYGLTAAPAGSEFQIDLAWTARHPPSGNYASQVALLDADGLLWSSKNTFRPRGYQKHPRTTLWRPESWVWDSHSVPILPGTPPGTYQLVLTVFRRTDLTPLNILDAAGRVAGPDVVIGELTVERPASPVALPVAQPAVSHQWGDLTLLDARLDRSEAAPGDPVLVALLWRAEAPLPELSARLELLGPAGTLVHSWALPLIRAGFSPSDWPVGDELMGQHLVQIPARTADGRHSWELTVLGPAGVAVGPAAELGWLVASAPERVWDQPESMHPADIRYSLDTGASFAQLVGYDLGQLRPGDHLSLTLVWEALAETKTSYRVYVHLLAADGTLVTQSDGIPAGWSRPTTGWLPGEFVADLRSLAIPADLPAGDYTLTAGFYELATGDRLEASQDAIAVLSTP